MSFDFKIVPKKDKAGFNWVVLTCDCGNYDPLSLKTLYDILHNIAIEEERYLNNGGIGSEFFAWYVYECCNPNITFEELRKKYLIPKKTKKLDEYM